MPSPCRKFGYLRTPAAGQKNEVGLPNMSRIFLIALTLTLFIHGASAQVTGRDIVRKMHDRYAGKWYHTFTFNQTTEMYRTTGTITQTWYEFIRFPDRLRI